MKIFPSWTLVILLCTSCEAVDLELSPFDAPGCGGVGKWPAFYEATNGTHLALAAAEGTLSEMEFSDEHVIGSFAECVSGKLSEVGGNAAALATRIRHVPFVELHRTLGALALYDCNPTRNAFMDRAEEYAARGGLLPVLGANVVPPGKGKIFQIGYNKCATRSIWHCAVELQIPAAHNNFLARDETGAPKLNRRGRPYFLHISAVAHDNVRAGRPILSGMEHFDYFGDAGLGLCEPATGSLRINDLHSAFPFLEAQHPGSLFVLNVRTVADWVRSRAMHDWGKTPYCLKPFADANPWAATAWELDLRLFYTHVLDYFSCRPRQLLVMDIATDADWDALCRFMARDPAAVCPRPEHIGQSGQ